MAKRKPKQPKQELVVAAPLNESTSLIQVIARAASDPTVDVTKMEKLLEMHTKILERDAEAEFNNAMNAAQSEIGRIAADANNTQTRSRYATYAKLDSVLRPIYIRHGFSLSFDTDPTAPAGNVHVKCYVSHKAGHTRPYNVMIPASGKGAKGGDVMTDTHATGSAMQYGMRYLLKYIFNVAIGDDDDGNVAGAGPKIDEKQVAEINRLLNETDSGSGHYKEDFFCYLSKHGKVTISKTEEIPAVMFNDAKAALERKKQEKSHG